MPEILRGCGKSALATIDLAVRDRQPGDDLGGILIVRLHFGEITCPGRTAWWLWDTMEHAVAMFGALDKPDAIRFGVTALNVPGKQFIWLDDPDGDHSWPLA